MRRKLIVRGTKKKKFVALMSGTQTMAGSMQPSSPRSQLQAVPDLHIHRVPTWPLTRRAFSMQVEVKLPIKGEGLPHTTS